MDGIGSGDLWGVMDELAGTVERAKQMKEDKPETAIAHIKEVVKRRLAQLLLARFLILTLLVQEAEKLPGGLRQKEHRRLWVLLQVQPRIFNQESEEDIFTGLTRVLQHASTNDLRHRIRSQFKKLYPLLPKVRNPAIDQYATPPFFCVLDDVQVTASSSFGHLAEFMSNDNKTSRSILREIWLSWSEVLAPEQMRLVLSGTAIELQSLNDTLRSAAFKAYPYQVVNDIGGFDDPISQAGYIKRYVPAHFDEPCWAEFLTRAWAWFRGR